MVLHVKPYNTQTNKYDGNYFYVTTVTTPSSSEVTKSADGRFYMYNNKAYVFDHTESETDFYLEIPVAETGVADSFSMLSIPRTETEAISLVSYTQPSSIYFTTETSGTTQKIVLYYDDGDSSTDDTYEKADSSSFNGLVSVATKSYKTDMIYSEADYKDEYGNTITSASSGNTHNVYAYYDTRTYAGNTYLIAPLGRIYYDIDENGAESNEVVWYYSNFSNLQALIDSKIIMLGKDIQSSTNTNAVAFKRLMGSAIISYCYYYIKPVEGPYETYVSQYIGSINIGTTTYLANVYTYNDKDYTGPIYSVPVNSTLITTIVAANKLGVVGSINNISVIGQTNTLHSSLLSMFEANRIHHSTTQLATSDGRSISFSNTSYYTEYESLNEISYINQNNAETPAYTTPEEEFTYSNNGETYNYEISYVYYSVVENSGTLELSKQQLYKIGSDYYDVTDFATIRLYRVTKENGNYSYYDNVAFEETFLEDDNYTLKEEYRDNENFNYSVVSMLVYTGAGTIQPVQTSTGVLVRNYSFSAVNPESEIQSFTASEYYTTTGEGSLTQYLPVTLDFSSVYGNAYFKGQVDTDGKVYPVNANGQLIKDANTIQNAYLIANAGGQQLSVTQAERDIELSMELVMRECEIINAGTKTQAYLMGKYFMTNNSDPIIYPAFSSILATGQESALDINDKNTTFYTLDYTTLNNVIEGFPGIRLLAGSPYPNPVLTVQVRHKANESAGINVVLDVKQAYYVELISTLMQKEESNIVLDFTTYAFKDTLTNLTQNDYIDKVYQLLDPKTLNPVYGYYENASGDFVAYMTDANGQALPLTIQEVGINDNDPYLYYADSLAANGKYINKVYFRDPVSGVCTPVMYERDVIIWGTSSTSMQDVPYYDIHSYTQGLDGMIYLNSGMLDSTNSNCVGLTGLTGGATKTSGEGYDYSQVIIGGTTAAFRTSVKYSSPSAALQGYFEDKLIPVANPYSSTDPYFLTGKESAIIIANPSVNINEDDIGSSYIYRFKEWLVFTRYNSEILYYNKAKTESLIDRYNAILRFTTNEAGYFVFLPVYERVYTLGLATQVQNGAVNQGGSISIQYKDGEAVNIEDERVISKDTLYFADYLETEVNGNTGYYYSNIEAQPYLYFSGDFNEDGEPIFYEKSNQFNVVALKDKYVKIQYNTAGKITGLKILPVLDKLEENTEGKKDKEGIVKVENGNGLYSFKYNKKGENVTTKSIYYLADLDGVKILDILDFVYYTRYFYDGLTGESDNSRYAYVATRENSVGNLEFYAYSFVDILEGLGVIATGIGDITRLTLLYTYGEISVNRSTDYLYSMGTHFATAFTRTFTPIGTIVNPMIENGYRTNNSGALRSEEMMITREEITEEIIDAGGNPVTVNRILEVLNQHLAYKTSYYDRDTTVVLTATPDDGYRFIGWKQAFYDQDTNTFVLD